eukprot:65652-Rhodomonas_salina.1
MFSSSSPSPSSLYAMSVVCMPVCYLAFSAYAKPLVRCSCRLFGPRVSERTCPAAEWSGVLPVRFMTQSIRDDAGPGEKAR